MLKAQKGESGQAPELYEIVTRLEFESQGVLKFTPIANEDGTGTVDFWDAFGSPPLPP